MLPLTLLPAGAVVLGAALLFAAPAVAVTVAPAGGPGRIASLDLELEGIPVTMSGFGKDFDGRASAGTPARIVSRRRGVAAHSPGAGWGIAGGEALLFDFGGETVALRGLSFLAPRRAADSEFRLFVDGELVMSALLRDGLAARRFSSFFFAPGELTGSVIAVQGMSGTGGSGLRNGLPRRTPGFLLSSIEVDPLDGQPPVFPPEGVADAPLPAGLALLIAALSALGLFRFAGRGSVRAAVLNPVPLPALARRTLRPVRARPRA